MTLTRKIVLSIAGTLLTVVLGFCGYSSWTEWQYKRYGGYAAAGIEPIPGAELIFYKDESSGFLPDYDTTWIYKIPASYTDKLYKDCSAMHYKTGTFIAHEKDGTDRIDPRKPGCYIFIEVHSEFISIQFSGDQLTVEDTLS